MTTTGRKSPGKPPRGKRTRPGYQDGGAIFGDDGSAGLGAFAGGEEADPATVAPGGIGDAYNALFAWPSAPADDGSSGLGAFATEGQPGTMPVVPGGIGDVYNAIRAWPAQVPDEAPDLSIGPFLANHLERYYPACCSRTWRMR